ncbi:hypothetical protein V8F20_007667 [Naviculisporaceae sp. PSN 640]
MRTPVVLQILLAGTALSVPHNNAGERAHRVERAAALSTNVLASAAGTGQAFATLGAVMAGANSGGRAASNITPRNQDEEPAAPMPAEAIPVAHRVQVRQAATTVVASAGGFATASVTPNHVKAGAGGMAGGSSIQITKRRPKVEAVNELPQPVPHRIEGRQTSIILSINAASTATASAAPLGVFASGSGRGMGSSSVSGPTKKRREAETPEVQAVQRTASGALSMALMGDVDLDLFKETVETVAGYTSNLQEVLRTYSQKAEAAQTLEEVTKAIDAQQLTADVAAPLTQINDALYTGVSRMVSSSQRRKRRHGISGLQNVVDSYDLTNQLIELIIIIIKAVAGLLDTTGSGTGTVDSVTSLLSSLLQGLLGSSTNLLNTDASGVAGVDLLATLLNTLLGLSNGFVAIDGVTNTLTPILGF